MADMNSLEERSTRGRYSLTGDPVSFQSSSQHSANTPGHSTTSTPTPKNSLGNQHRNVPSGASEAGVDMSVVT